MAPLAPEAPDVVLDEHPVAVDETVPLGESTSGALDHADVFVPHDDGIRVRRFAVHLNVGAADPGDLDAKECAVVRDVGHRELTKLGPAGGCPDRRQHTLRHECSRDPIRTMV
jgi:hypothetical protein